MEKLELKLKQDLEDIKEKYSYQKNNISEYLKEVNDTFYEYGAVTENISYEYVLNDIISGEDCEGYVLYANPKAFYYWKNINGKTTVTEVDYDLLTELVDKALEEMNIKEKDIKDKDLDIC